MYMYMSCHVHVRVHVNDNNIMLVYVHVQQLCSFAYADLEMAIAYWNIVLKDRFKFLDIWCQFLQVKWVWSL